MSFYRESNLIIPNPLADDSVVLKTVPTGYYRIGFDLVHGFHLEIAPTPEMPPRLYGEINKNADLIFGALEIFGTSSALLSGLKGCGKSLTIKEVCRRAIANGMIVLFIESAFVGPDFTAFLSKIKQPHCLVFDEFEKVYAKTDEQNGLLSMLDGFGNPQGRVVLITANYEHRISEMLINRPGRIRYHLRHVALSESFVREYCEDQLKRRELTDTICKMAAHSVGFSFDLLSTLVNELNARPTFSVEDATAVLNLEATNLIHNYQVIRLACVSNPRVKLKVLGRSEVQVNLSSNHNISVYAGWTEEGDGEDTHFPRRRWNDFHATAEWKDVRIFDYGTRLVGRGSFVVDDREELFELELIKSYSSSSYSPVGFGYSPSLVDYED